MSLPTILLIALGLAMDAFAVSVASGFAAARFRITHALRMALSFGIFQAIMPLLGWSAGLKLRALISGVDHWVAFGLLAAVGGKMIYESFRIGEEEKASGPISFCRLMVLSVATSIDALAVGLTLSFLKVAIALPAAIIGVITFCLSLVGVYLGKRIGHLFENKIELVGGLILIAIGIKILFEHLSAA